MKRIIKSTLLSIMLLTSALVFSQSASAHYGHGYGHGYGNGCGCYKTYSCNYDCCSGCSYRTVTTWKSYFCKYNGYTCECGCPKCYTYVKRYSYPVKSVKYYCYSNCYRPCNTCNTCNTCNSCNYGSGYSY